MSEALASFASIEFDKGTGEEIQKKLGAASGVVDSYIDSMSDTDEVQIMVGEKMQTVNKKRLKQMHKNAIAEGTQGQLYDAIGHDMAKRQNAAKQQVAAQIKALNFQKI